MEKNGLYRDYIKKILDIALSTVALIVLSPLLFITAILVRIKLGSPVIFKQPRPGKDEKIFYLLKFRSMTNEIGEDGRLLPDSQRLTKFGKFLRSSSLDELLELINIIKGDMSIVGPRPLSIFYLPHYPSSLRRRHDVRPGLTGLAQVHGRNNLPWDDRFVMDIEYVDNVSFVTDVKIILDTALKVLKQSDIAVRGANQVKDYGPYCVLKEEGKGGIRMQGMTFSEIGSYFWLDRSEKIESKKGINWLPAMNDSCFTFSGRNAIDVVIRDILKNQRIDVVYAPSYCCVSMLQEFIDRGLKIAFYDINFENGRFTYQIPEVLPHSVVLIMSYFGLNTMEAHRAIERLHNSGSIIIEDITHSLLRKDTVSNSCDYVVASLRKWFAIPTGGWAGKKRGSFSEKPGLDSNHAVQEKIAAMKEKYDYLTGKVDSKENFLLAQANFENDLIHVDRMLKIDDVSLSIIERLNIDEIITRRRQNAGILIDGLKDLSSIIQIPQIDMSVDVPLFVPVIMETEKRDSLRQYLIERGIYCPVHWPETMGAAMGIRANELSLICDQRYSVGDMKAIVDTIKYWYHKLFEKGRIAE
ncbi:hypothetical protein Lac2_04520 [Claveliimonas bilis]|uniref:sugar transferase n=1 Tax=Claveliimonas bilis TaxID=3028070 RepID=UPI00292FEB78|nr:sugar transferase [Claveliimonas bilis]BDZ82318.1 hypothetical protein Lac2_04520 [Claveliimonas bilis]